jgi:hypothetical protein
MPWPKGPVQAGVKGENSALHIMVDNTSEQPAAASVGATMPQADPIPMGSFVEMLLGHRSGGTNKPAPFLDLGSVRFGRGGTVTYAAGTLTDTNQNWVVNIFGAAGFGVAFGVIATDVTGGGQYNVIASNTATVLTLKSNWATTPGAGAPYSIIGVADQNQGATVSYAAGPANALVDTGKAWTANQWRGRYVMVANQLRLIVSNTATQLTLDAAWSATPAAQQAYFISDPMYPSWLETQRGTTGGYTAGGPDMNPNNL